MTVSTTNAVPPKPTKSRNPSSSVSRRTNSRGDSILIECVPRNLSFWILWIWGGFSVASVYVPSLYAPSILRPQRIMCSISLLDYYLTPPLSLLPSLLVLLLLPPLRTLRFFSHSSFLYWQGSVHIGACSQATVVLGSNLT